MQITNLKLQNYRNYQELNLNLKEGIHIFTGKNAQGKTNILEAIYYTSLGKSHRTNDDKDLIQNTASEASVKIEFKNLDIVNTLTFKFFLSKNRLIEFNQEKTRPKDIVGQVNSVLFSPEDLYLVKGSPQNRRLFLDMEISKAHPFYYQELITYKKILQQRNSLLKQIREKKVKINLIDFWNQKHAASSAKIVLVRLKALQKIQKIAQNIHFFLTQGKEDLHIDYIPQELDDIDMKDMKNIENNLKICYNQKIAKILTKEIERGYTLIGPHRDDLSFKLANFSLQNFASQGQQRTAVLALKLSELEYLYEVRGDYPILLLDDVLSELDSERQKQLINIILKKNIQTLITATEEEKIPKILENSEKIINYHVKEGKINII